LSLSGRKAEAFKHRKAVDFTPVFVLIPTYGHESWVIIEKVLPQVHAPEMGFL